MNPSHENFLRTPLFAGHFDGPIWSTLPGNILLLVRPLLSRCCRSHFFRLRLRSCCKIFQSLTGSGSGKFFKFDSPTPVQTPATIDPNKIYVCFHLINDHADCCYCRNWKAAPDPGPVFLIFMTPSLGPNEKRRILPESTLVLRIHGHLCQRGTEQCVSKLFCSIVPF